MQEEKNIYGNTCWEIFILFSIWQLCLKAYRKIKSVFVKITHICDKNINY